MSAWYCSRDRCSGCENYTGDCLYDLELEEQEDNVEPGTYTKAEYCPYFSSKENYDD